MTPKALADIIKKESDPELHRLELLREAISTIKILTPENNGLQSRKYTLMEL